MVKGIDGQMNPLILFSSLILLGGLIGLIAGLVGIGGTSLIVPFLIWFFLHINLSLDLAVKTAFGSALLVSTITALTGFLIHRKKVDIKWSLILPLAMSVIIGAFCGSTVAHFVRGSYLLIFFITALYIIALYMLFNFKDIKTPSLELRPVVVILTGLGTGFFASLVGLGGGLFTIIIFTLFFRQPIHEVVGISTFVQVFGALSGSIGYMINGYVNFLVVLAMLIGGIPSAQFGAKLAHKMEAKSLHRIFGGLLFLIATILIAGRFK